DARVGLNVSGVTDLAAALGVEGGLVEDNLHLFPCLGALLCGLGPEDTDYGARRLGRLIAQEDGRLVGQVGVECGARACLVAEESGAGTALLPLGGHRPVEALAVDGQPGVGRKFFGQLVREAVGVVETERFGAGDDRLTARAEVRRQRLEAADTGRERAAEVLLLVPNHLADALLLLAQVRVVLGEHIDDDVRDLSEEGPVDADQAAVAHGAAQDAAQDVAAALVAGEDTVADQEGDGATVVGDDAQRAVDLRVLAVLDPGQFGRLQEYRHVEVGLEDGADDLEDHGDALQAHPGVDVLARQRALGAVLFLVELHEDEVPDLEEAIAVIAAGPAAGPAAAQLLAAVVKDLRVGAVRTGGADGAPPVVLVAQPRDEVLGDADLVAPEGEGELVVAVHRGA